MSNTNSNIGTNYKALVLASFSMKHEGEGLINNSVQCIAYAVMGYHAEAVANGDKPASLAVMERGSEATKTFADQIALDALGAKPKQSKDVKTASATEAIKDWNAKHAQIVNAIILAHELSKAGIGKDGCKIVTSAKGVKQSLFEVPAEMLLADNQSYYEDKKIKAPTTVLLDGRSLQVVQTVNGKTGFSTIRASVAQVTGVAQARRVKAALLREQERQKNVATNPVKSSATTAGNEADRKTDDTERKVDLPVAEMSFEKMLHNVMTILTTDKPSTMTLTDLDTPTLNDLNAIVKWFDGVKANTAKVANKAA